MMKGWRVSVIEIIAVTSYYRTPALWHTHTQIYIHTLLYIIAFKNSRRFCKKKKNLMVAVVADSQSVLRAPLIEPSSYTQTFIFHFTLSHCTTSNKWHFHYKTKRNFLLPPLSRRIRISRHAEHARFSRSQHRITVKVAGRFWKNLEKILNDSAFRKVMQRAPTIGHEYPGHYQSRIDEYLFLLHNCTYYVLLA